QRVAVARALAQIEGAKRPLLLLDEPFSGVDPGEVARVVGALREIARSGAVVLSLHDPGLARLIATRALVLREGRMLFDGPARDVLTAANLSAAYRHTMIESAAWIVPAIVEQGTMGS
ncbi:MAG: Fe3+-complex transporter ATP-binding protein, partial [Planctomycetota bacterium]